MVAKNRYRTETNGVSPRSLTSILKNSACESGSADLASGRRFANVRGPRGDRMRAFKFRPSTKIEFALDILINRRLHCADWRALNDPMEGLFVYATDGQESRTERVVKGIGDAKSRYRVCSLSRDFQSHLLWAHYAGGFDGLAIEVDLPDDDLRVREVQYRGVFAFLDQNDLQDEEEAARTILFSKNDEWRYEQEIRILSPEPYYDLERPIRRVIVGHRMNQALFRTLHMVCEREGIEFTKIGIGDEGIDADPIQPRDLQRERRRMRNR